VLELPTGLVSHTENYNFLPLQTKQSDWKITGLGLN